MRKNGRNNRNNHSSATNYSDIVDRIKPVGETSEYVSQVTYGRSGTGKTTHMSTWPKPILILDIKEEGTDSIKTEKDVDFLPIESWEDIEKVYWYLESGDHPYKSVGIDTVTQMQDLCMKSILSRNNSSFATKQNWGQMAELMKTWLLQFRDLPLHINFLAQDRTNSTDTEEDDQVAPEVGPRLSPGVAGFLNAAVKNVVNTYIYEVVSKEGGRISRSMEYRMRTGPHPYYLTKVRKPKESTCPEHIVNPTFADIVKIMNGQWKSSTPAKKAKKSSRLRKGK